MSLSSKDCEYCLEMVRHFVSGFDSEAAFWLQAHDKVVGEVLTGYLDRLTARQRLDLYSLLFGFFRQHYEHVINVRLRLEQDPKCRDRLATLEQLHRELIRRPYTPITDEELLLGSEKNLLHSDARVRYVAALALWVLTKDPQKVVPTLLGIIKDPTSEPRIEAVALLAEMRLDDEVKEILHNIALDADDSACKVAAKALLGKHGKRAS